MFKFHTNVLFLLIISSLSTGCANTSGVPSAMLCKELKSQMMLNGATSIVQQSELQRAESHLQQRDYRAIGCEEMKHY